MQSKASTVADYLSELPADRRAALAEIRAVILRNLDKNFEEGMQYGMIGYYVPHRLYPAGYHCDPRQPLPFAALASQKNHMSVYLMSVYADGAEERWLRDQWARAGKKLDMGKCCIRFKRIEDVPLEVLGEAFRRVTAQRHIEYYETAFRASRGRSGGDRKAGRSSAGAKSKSKSASAGKRSARPARKTAARKSATRTAAGARNKR